MRERESAYESVRDIRYPVQFLHPVQHRVSAAQNRACQDDSAWQQPHRLALVGNKRRTSMRQPLRK